MQCHKAPPIRNSDLDLKFVLPVLHGIHVIIVILYNITALRKWGGAHQTSNHLPKPNL